MRETVLSVPLLAACDFELACRNGEIVRVLIGTPADVRAQCNHDAVMRAPWPAAGMPF
jgi:hypothetical protein